MFVKHSFMLSVLLCLLSAFYFYSSSASAQSQFDPTPSSSCVLSGNCQSKFNFRRPFFDGFCKQCVSFDRPVQLISVQPFLTGNNGVSGSFAFIRDQALDSFGNTVQTGFFSGQITFRNPDGTTFQLRSNNLNPAVPDIGLSSQTCAFVTKFTANNVFLWALAICSSQVVSATGVAGTITQLTTTFGEGIGVDLNTNNILFTGRTFGNVVTVTRVPAPPGTSGTFILPGVPAVTGNIFCSNPFDTTCAFFGRGLIASFDPSGVQANLVTRFGYEPFTFDPTLDSDTTSFVNGTDINVFAVAISF